MVHQQTDEPVGKCGPLVKRLRHRPLTPVTGVRFPHGSPCYLILAWNRTREGFDRKRKARSGFPVKGAQRLVRKPCRQRELAADSPTGHQIYLGIREGEFCKKLVGRKPGHHFILHIYFDIRGRKSFDIQSVIITLRTHLFPFRTQKLSSAVPKILGGKLPGKIGRRRHNSLCLLH